MNARARKALLILLLTAPLPSIGAAFALYLAPGTVGNGVYGVCKALLYGLPLLWVLRVEGRKLRVPRPTARGLGLGLATGLVLGGVILAAWFLHLRHVIDAGPIRAQAAESGWASRSRYLFLAGWFIVVNALLEEYVFRWFFYGRCRELLGEAGGAVLAALLFTAHHVLVLRNYFDGSIVLYGSAGVFAAGLVWTWVYARKGTVWPGYVSHMLADFALLWVGWELLFS